MCLGYEDIYTLLYMFFCVSVDLLSFTCSSRSLSLIVRHCKRLRTLDVSECRGITATEVDFLQSHLPFLENLHCRSVNGVDLNIMLWITLPVIWKRSGTTTTSAYVLHTWMVRDETFLWVRVKSWTSRPPILHRSVILLSLIQHLIQQ